MAELGAVWIPSFLNFNLSDDAPSRQSSEMHPNVGCLSRRLGFFDLRSWKIGSELEI